MERILDLLDTRQRAFAAHPFLRRMERTVSVVVPGLAFWVLTFHDLLESCEPRMVDPELRRILRHHLAEESGHDVWYLEDLQRLGVPLPDPTQLFGPTHQGVRRASYALMAEAIRSQSDWVRIALVLMMEATGAVFFTRASQYRHWPAEGLAFFSGRHLEVEKAHELFERRMRDWLRGQRLSDADFAESRAAVDRGFAAFGEMFDGIEAEVTVPWRGEGSALREGRPDALR
jgi:hypothetical protein